MNERHRRIMDWLTKAGLGATSRVLEIGCGVGTQTELIAGVVTGGHVMANDISPKSVESARQRTAHLRNVDFLVGDIVELRVDGSFDFIVLPDVLEHIPTLGATLTEALTTLKPAAQLHITPRVDPLTPAVGPVIGREHPLGVTAEFWRRWAASHGLAVRLAAHQPPSEPIPCEMVALVAPPGAPDLEALDLGDGVVEAL